MKFKLLTLLAFCLLSIKGSAQSGQNIAITIQRKANNKPIVAYVTMGSQQKLATENGIVNFKGITEGSNKVIIHYLGYEFVKNIFIKPNQNKYLLKIDFKTFKISEIKVYASNKKSPIAYKTISQKEIAKTNLAKDVPYLLKRMPNAVVNSDAGNGVGYTSMRIRGIDAKGINVNINGVPLNDAEGHGVYWVDIPDIANSANNMQVQRGLGTSVNGSGAFGANIYVNTLEQKPQSFITLNSTLGSFNTQKYSAKFGTGLLNNHWNLLGSISKISSDGYIDRSSSLLNSYYFSLGYVGKKSKLTLVHFAGNEITGQAWNGTPQAKADGDKKGLIQHYNNEKYTTYKLSSDSANLFNSARTYNKYLYNNQVDDYGQRHYQLHYNRNLGHRVNLKTAAFYTKGKGFYEQFRNKDETKIYGYDSIIKNGVIYKKTDAIRQLWLDNDLYGLNASVNKKYKKNKVLLAGAYQVYKGKHYGKVLWTNQLPLKYGSQFYSSYATKTDGNILARLQQKLGKNSSLLTEIQIRRINYKGKGNDNKLDKHDFSTNFLFINPKIGISHITKKENQSIKKYAYIGIGNREPNRTDFVDNARGTTPKSEQLLDIETGINWAKNNVLIETNVYFMNYKNQLIPTGKLNDVGASLRENTPQSYRAGVELSGTYTVGNFNILGNISLSRNKIKNFDEYIFDYGTNAYQVNSFWNTDIAFSPTLVANIGLEYLHKGWTFGLMPKYVGKQYLDNTMNADRRLNGYLVSDFQIIKQIKLKNVKNISFNLSVYNLFNKMYSANGYTYSYIYGSTITENFVYPQAGRHFLLGVKVDI